MDGQVFALVADVANDVWTWSGWPRLADIAAVATAIVSGFILISLRVSRRSQVRALEAYLKKIGRIKRAGEQGLRSEEHLSRHLQIPLSEIPALAHSSKRLVSRIRTDTQTGETKLMWGYNGLVPDK